MGKFCIDPLEPPCLSWGWNGPRETWILIRVKYYRRSVLIAARRSLSNKDCIRWLRTSPECPGPGPRWSYYYKPWILRFGYIGGSNTMKYAGKLLFEFVVWVMNRKILDNVLYCYEHDISFLLIIRYNINIYNKQANLYIIYYIILTTHLILHCRQNKAALLPL